MYKLCGDCGNPLTQKEKGRIKREGTQRVPRCDKCLFLFNTQGYNRKKEGEAMNLSEIEAVLEKYKRFEIEITTRYRTGEGVKTIIHDLYSALQSAVAELRKAQHEAKVDFAICETQQDIIDGLQQELEGLREELEKAEAEYARLKTHNQEEITFWRENVKRQGENHDKTRASLEAEIAQLRKTRFVVGDRDMTPEERDQKMGEWFDHLTGTEAVFEEIGHKSAFHDSLAIDGKAIKRRKT